MSLPDTRPARDAILSALRSAGPVPPRPAPDLGPFLEGPFGRGTPGDTRALALAFETAATGWRADVVHAGPDHWPEAVRAWLDARGLRRVAYGPGLPGRAQLEGALSGLEPRCMDMPIEDFKAELFDRVDAGVTGCLAGIADTGSLVLRPGPGEPRTLSLVPGAHVALLRRSQIFPSLARARAHLTPEADMPTNLLLVSGPSKTADIQQVLAYGAHGPRQLAIVLIDDLAEGDPR